MGDNGRVKEGGDAHAPPLPAGLALVVFFVAVGVLVAGA